MFQAFWKCPTFEKYSCRDGLHKTLSYFEFGEKFHKKLEGFYGRKPAEPDAFEETLNPLDLEVEVMFQAYKAAYPSENFEVLDCEKSFELMLPVSTQSGPDRIHFYLGKIDMLVRDNETKKLRVFETKTESRNSKRNLPQAWAARTQASLYTWAATQIYGEPIDSVVLNIATKSSPKGQVGPSFRRDLLERTPLQIDQALKDLIWVADRLEEMEENGVYPRNTNNCVNEYGFPCDYYSVCHAGGMTPEKLMEFVQVEPFSHLTL